MTVGCAGPGRFVRLRCRAVVMGSVVGMLAGACGTEPAGVVPDRIRALGGQGQVARVTDRLPLPLEVQGLDSEGKAAMGASIIWTVESGGGSVSRGRTTTDGEGVTQVTWTLGTVAGEQSVVARSEAGEVVFSAQAEPGDPDTVAMSPEQFVADALGRREDLAAVVLDAHGNVVSGDVRWSSSSPSVAVVDTAGVVTALANGAAEIVASYGALSGSVPVDVQQAAATLERVSGDRQAGYLFEPLPEPLVVRVRDPLGQPAAGVEVRWGTRFAGLFGTVEARNPVTDSDGLAAGIWTLGSVDVTERGNSQSASAGVPGGLISLAVGFTATGRPRESGSGAEARRDR